MRRRQNKITCSSIYGACAFRALYMSQFKLEVVTWPWNGMLFLFCKAAILETTRLPIQWVPTVLCPELIRPGVNLTIHLLVAPRLRTCEVIGYFRCMLSSCRAPSLTLPLEIATVTSLGAGFVSAPKRPDPLWCPLSSILNKHSGCLSGGRAAWSWRRPLPFSA